MNTTQQDTMYPTYDEVVNVVQAFQREHLPEYELITLHLKGDSLRSFYARFVRNDQIMQLSLNILPNRGSKGWHVENPHLWHVHTVDLYHEHIEPYPQYLRDLMECDSSLAIVSLDNEDDAYPEGHPIFGYALITPDKTIVAFVQHDGMDEDDKPYTYNPHLPHGQIVTDPVVLDVLNDNERLHLEKWHDDEKEWW